jgi:pimeloyl-ACP methyl ester carboxylesterase
MSRAKVRDLELHYDESGSGDPLVLIMGLGADSNAWMRQVPEFSRHHQTITFDNRGVGRSSKPPGPYSTRQMADETAGLMDHLGIDRAQVVGVSMGGMIAQELAINYPARVGALVLACTYAEPSPEIEALRQNSLQFFGASGSLDGNGSASLPELDPMAILQYMLPLIFSERFICEELPELLPQLTAGLAYGFSLEALLGQVTACMTHDTSDRLRTITRPTLVITGTDDRLVAPHHSDALAAAIPGAKLVKLDGGTHGFNLEMAELFNSEVGRFFAAHPLTTSR